MTTYKIIRYYRDHPNRTLREGLTLEQAQEHCTNPETSCTTATTTEHAEKYGPWFDGYRREE